MSATEAYIAFFFAGVLLALLGTVWAMGPVARTWAVAHMLKQRIVDIPRSDRTKEYRRVSRRNVDDKGRYWIKFGNMMKVFRIDPRWVYIAGGKNATTTLLEGVGINVDPVHAKLAETREKTGRKNPALKIWGENVDWHSLARQLGEWMGGDHIAGIFGSAIASTKPIDPLKNPRGAAIKWILVVVVVVAILAGLYVAKAQKWI